MKLKPGMYNEAQVRSIKLPPHIQSTDSFEPLTHDEVLNYIDDGLDRAGLKPVRDAQGNVQRTFTLAGDGARMYGTMPIDVDVLAPQGADTNDGIRLQLGVVNSFNRTLSCRIGFGSVVSVCSNGSIFAEKVLGRKHTTFIRDELPGRIDEALNSTQSYIDAQGKFFQRLREIELNTPAVHDLVVRMAQQDAIVKGEILDIVEEYHHPRHEVFEQPTAWALHNAVTESAKRIQQKNGVEFAERAVKITGIFAKEFAPDLSLPVGISLN